MRYELSNKEWSIISPMLPTKPRGIPRVNSRRVLNGIFWVLRSGVAPWRDLPSIYGPRTTCYNRFVRWRRARIWDGIMQALTVAQDAAVQMIDTSMVRVHQQAACIADSGPHLYRARNRIERFFNRIKHCRRIATRYDKLAANYLTFVQLASIRLWLRVYEFTT